MASKKKAPLVDGFPPDKYEVGVAGFQTGNFRFEDNNINNLDEDSGFSDEVSEENFEWSMDNNGDIQLYIARVESEAELPQGSVSFKIKENDAFTKFEKSVPHNDLSVFVNTTLQVGSDSLLQFFFTSGASTVGRLDLRPGVLAFLQHKSGLPYIDVSLDSKSRLGDISIRLSAKPSTA